MRVRVEGRAGRLAVQLLEGDDLGRFAVEVAPGVDLDRARTPGAGPVWFPTDRRALVDREWLRRAGGYAAGTAAGEAFDAMVAYAAKHGWVDEDSGAIAGHVEPADSVRE